MLSLSIQPVMLAPAYIPIQWGVTSNESAPELQLKVEIYVRETTTAALTLRAVKMEPRYMGGSMFLVDVSDILQSLLSCDDYGAVTAGITSPNDKSIIEYQLIFYEVLNDAYGLITIGDSITSAILCAVNAAKQPEENNNLDLFTIYSTGA